MAYQGTTSSALGPCVFTCRGFCGGRSAMQLKDASPEMMDRVLLDMLLTMPAASDAEAAWTPDKRVSAVCTSFVSEQPLMTSAVLY